MVDTAVVGCERICDIKDFTGAKPHTATDERKRRTYGKLNEVNDDNNAVYVGVVRVYFAVCGRTVLDCEQYNCNTSTTYSC